MTIFLLFLEKNTYIGNTTFKTSEEPKPYGFDSSMTKMYGFGVWYLKSDSSNSSRDKNISFFFYFIPTNVANLDIDLDRNDGLNLHCDLQRLFVSLCVRLSGTSFIPKVIQLIYNSILLKYLKFDQKSININLYYKISIIRLIMEYIFIIN